MADRLGAPSGRRHDPTGRFEDWSPLPAPAPHEVELVDEGAFTVAVCTGCGWRSYARRSRPLARREGDAHVAQYRSA
ncbi:MAG: hypothetical protein MUC45_10470 [Actinomycetia bacterium]|jgi:hypothetical protein|nr:hypothetical protein [Actinomycetes bacterium]